MSVSAHLPNTDIQFPYWTTTESGFGLTGLLCHNEIENHRQQSLIIIVPPSPSP
jgi:hypothetical protein